MTPVNVKRSGSFVFIQQADCDDPEIAETVSILLPVEQVARLIDALREAVA